MQLAQIFEKVKTENARSKQKYGLWSVLPDFTQGAAIQGEYREWYEAYTSGYIRGEHGEIVEAIQTINCLCMP